MGHFVAMSMTLGSQHLDSSVEWWLFLRAWAAHSIMFWWWLSASVLLISLIGKEKLHIPLAGNRKSPSTSRNHSFPRILDSVAGNRFMALRAFFDWTPPKSPVVHPTDLLQHDIVRPFLATSWRSHDWPRWVGGRWVSSRVPDWFDLCV